MVPSRLNLLIVDDDDLVPPSIRLVLPNHWRMTTFTRLTDFGPTPYDAALVDLHLTGNLQRAEGLDVIAHLRANNPNLEIVSMSGDLDRNRMEACLKAGASRFLAKPLNADELLLTLEKIEALILLREATSRGHLLAAPWVGSSRASEAVRRSIANLRSETSGPILIEGESGTGKEVAAGLLHAQETDHAARPFVSVNLAALPETVFESEMFGHVRGAFTGADTNKMGLCEAAHNGDLFLDEVEALPMSQQAKLLRFLETGEVRRVGAKESIRVKTRIIAATNRNLELLVKEGKFREDFLWRLNGRKLSLPPLRDRKEDIAELAEYFLMKDRPRRTKQLTSDALQTMLSHSWPGNVRELKRVIEHLSFQAPLPLIRHEDVVRVLPTIGVATAAGVHVDLSVGLTKLLEQYEANLIRSALEQRPDVEEAATLLGISRSSLYKKIKDYQIENQG